MLSAILIFIASFCLGFVAGAVWHGINNVSFPPPTGEPHHPTREFRRVPDHLPEDLE